MASKEQRKEVANRVRAAWQPCPVPAASDLFGNPPDLIEEHIHLHAFGGKRFDEVDCQDLRTTAFTWLAYLKPDAKAYYAGALILCQLEHFLGAPDDEYS